MTALNREAFRNQSKKARKIVPVTVPDMDGQICVREFSAAEKDFFEKSRILENDEGDDKRASLENFRAKYVIATACDESGEPIFAPEDAEWLGKVGVSILDAIFEAAAKLNRTTAADIEELRKKSQGRKSDGSTGSASPDSAEPPTPTNS